MKYQISQDFNLESARYLPNLPQTHPCSQMHGHSFRVRLILVGELDSRLGWLMDYNEIENTVGPIFKTLDHKVLNQVAGLENPTTELLARWIFEKCSPLLPPLWQVVINETPRSQVAYPFRG